MELTLEKFKAAYPDLFDKIDADAYARGLEQGKKDGAVEGEKTGAQKERERIQAVEAQSLPGHEKLIAELKYDGVTTGEQAAVKVLAAERTVLTVKKDTYLAEHTKVAAAVETTAEPLPEQAEAEGPLTDEQIKADWDKDAKIRAEFGNNYDSYLAYTRAQETGRVKIYRGGK